MMCGLVGHIGLAVAWWPKDYFTSIQPLGGKDRPQMAVLEKYTTANRNAALS